MPDVIRSSDLKEQYGERAFYGLIPGAIALIVGVIMLVYKSEMFVGLAWVLTLAGVAGVGYGVYQLMQIHKVQTYDFTCPYCQHKNQLLEKPDADFRCDGCQRQIPFQDGRVLRVWQVRCGYCNELNFYSEKSTGLICENCDREIPISTDEEVHNKATVQAFTIHEDTNPYDLVLTSKGPRGEDMIACLQKMLALNRNQVKDILEGLPAVLLTGIPKKKAEMLKAQIMAHGGNAEYHVTGQQAASSI